MLQFYKKRTKKTKKKKIKIGKNGSLFITTHKKLLCRNEMFFISIQYSVPIVSVWSFTILNVVKSFIQFCADRTRFAIFCEDV